MRRLGVLGGTFDPPHVGHASVASDVADALNLDRVLWIPAAIPPHKQDADITDDDVRLEMVEAACHADPRFEASDLELMRGGVSYTVDTLRAVRADFPGTELVLILGVDQFRTMDTGWKNPEGVLRLASLAVLDRDGTSAQESAPEVAHRGRVSFVPVTRVDVSSTEIREAVGEGRDISSLVAEGVRAIVERERLYRR